jgi:hypothetical protein
MKKLLATGILAGLGGLAAAPTQAQTAPQPAAQPVLVVAPTDAPTDEQSYRRETVFGINFNTQGGLIGGVNVRSARVMDNNLLWFWSLEGVFFKNPKEQTVTNQYTGGSFTLYKTNYAFALRPSIGIQRILFRKAAEAGVQVNGLLSAGPSIGLLMPYYISYDYTWASQPGRGPLQSDVIRDEQYDPTIHDPNYIIDRAPFFGGISHTQVVAGVHFRGALSFEYGRYRDAVAGAEVGFLVETYSKRLLTFAPPSSATIPTDLNALNKQFYPSVYLTLYLGHRN